MSEPRDGGGSEEEPPVEGPPEGSTCAEHSERPALAICPRCGNHACLGCWHHAIRRCHACLMRDPASAAPPIPWEDPTTNVVLRYLGTLASALRPTVTAPAFAREGTSRARTFFLLSFVPLAMLSWVVPATHTMLFAESFAFRWVGTPTPAEVALDVARAVGIGVVLTTIDLVAIGVPFLSLARAYADKGYERAPLRALLYRAFLIPLSLVVFSVVAWSLPSPPSSLQLQLAIVARLVPIVLLFWSLRSTARMASGAGPIASYLVAVVPLAIMLLAHEFLDEAVRSWLPAAVDAAESGDAAPPSPGATP